MRPRVRLVDYEDAVESSLGWCPHCRAFTHECAEPDAECYECPECGKHDVCGAEHALLMGVIDVA